jgi:hypothetical protein
VKTIEETPTRPANYVLISAVYAAAMAGTVAVSRRTGETPGGPELLPIGLATFTFTRVLTEQKVEEWLRRPFVEESTPGEKRPRGTGMRYAIGELLSCKRCSGAWVGLGLVALRSASPTAGRLAAAVGTVGAVNDVSLAGFAWLTSRANAAETEAEQAQDAPAPPVAAAAERAAA